VAAEVRTARAAASSRPEAACSRRRRARVLAAQRLDAEEKKFAAA
jgi:hypothetical protein